MIKSVDLLVIDEISMVRADLLDSVDEVLRRFRDRTKPFGGVRENRVDERTLEALNARHRPGFDPPQSEGYVTLASHNHTARRINDDKLARISAKEYVYRADIEGEFPEYLYRSMNGKSVKMQKT